jgi:hypothetical protein
MSHTHKDDEWKRDRNERAVRDHLRKITDPAENRMRTRTARAQLDEAMRKTRDPIPDDDEDDASAWGLR